MTGDDGADARFARVESFVKGELARPSGVRVKGVEDVAP
jgi:hypothetical protein